MTGDYSTAPGLSAIENGNSAYDQKVFQIDDQYDNYLQNKERCRAEDINKYYKESSLRNGTIETVTHFISQQLVKEHPDIFEISDGNLVNRKKGESVDLNNGTPYISVFDALANQVQEDLAVFQLKGDTDYLTAIHLCAPNHWSPGDKIGQPFGVIHRPVAEMERTLRNYPPMLKSIVSREGPFTRFAWGVGTDDRLNHHPVAPLGIDQKSWVGRTHESDNLYLRVERQNLVGFPKNDAFLFTIRTYFYGVDQLERNEKEMLWKAISSMSEATIQYKGLEGLLPLIKVKTTS